MLIGANYPEMHSSLKEVRGKQGEPIARLTPLGWTCIGKLPTYERQGRQKGAFWTYCVCNLEEEVRRFWELEEPWQGNSEYSPKEKEITSKESVSGSGVKFDETEVSEYKKTELNLMKVGEVEDLKNMSMFETDVRRVLQFGEREISNSVSGDVCTMAIQNVENGLIDLEITDNLNGRVKLLNLEILNKSRVSNVRDSFFSEKSSTTDANGEKLMIACEINEKVISPEHWKGVETVQIDNYINLNELDNNMIVLKINKVNDIHCDELVEVSEKFECDLSEMNVCDKEKKFLKDVTIEFRSNIRKESNFQLDKDTSEQLKVLIKDSYKRVDNVNEYCSEITKVIKGILSEENISYFTLVTVGDIESVVDGITIAKGRLKKELCENLQTPKKTRRTQWKQRVLSNWKFRRKTIKRRLILLGRIKVGIGNKREKRYICVFSCLKTRAVHLEVASNLETDAFLRVFTRMISRRGRPRLIISDHGTNFVGALRAIKDAVKEKYSVDVSKDNTGIIWIFNSTWDTLFQWCL